MHDKLILITGITGLWLAIPLTCFWHADIETVRSSKYQNILDTVRKPGLEFVKIDDVASDDFREALEGVDAVLHLACPLPGRKSLEETFKTAIEGTMNVVRQAQKAGIKKIVVTTTFGNLLNPSHRPMFQGLTFDESHWGDCSQEEFERNKDDKYYIYFTAKMKAEHALWDFAAEHPDFEVATILPGLVLGPYSRTFPLPISVGSMGTNDFIHGMINNGDVPFAPVWLVDVRDVAKAQIIALEKLPLPADDLKRFTINAGTFPWKKLAEHLLQVQPELRDRIIPLDTVPPLPGPLGSLDTTRAKEILGFTEYIPMEKTFEDAVDDILMLEKLWARKEQTID